MRFPKVQNPDALSLCRPQHRLLSEPPANGESVGELWLGLLRFYTEEFDFKEHVISIRQRKRLTTFEKQWTSKCIAIEGKTGSAAAVHTSDSLTSVSAAQSSARPFFLF